MTGIKEVQRSPVLECILAMDSDSTMESCPRSLIQASPAAPLAFTTRGSTWVSVVLSESSSLNAATRCRPPILGPLRAWRATAVREFPCKTHRQTALNALESRTVHLNKGGG